MRNNGKSKGNTEELLRLRDAAQQLGISFPAIKRGFTGKRFAALAPPEDITVFHKAKWTDCCFEPGQEQRLSGNLSCADSAEETNW